MVDEQKTTPPKVEPSVALAHEIAMMLWDRGFRGPDGLTVIGMAMGIYMEAQEGAHRGLKPIADVLCLVAQRTFDAFQQSKARRGEA